MIIYSKYSINTKCLNNNNNVNNPNLNNIKLINSDNLSLRHKSAEEKCLILLVFTQTHTSVYY